LQKGELGKFPFKPAAVDVLRLFGVTSAESLRFGGMCCFEKGGMCSPQLSFSETV
jgi:hypothetical protein